ncbi:MAG: 7-carboxy-7-deazaguanine synthase QueE [Gammaproteobacteria bacterium]|nr:7-carboxy-7-deazaguanine synthase QueE [Gammaproteobacteria bacterium]
MPTLRITEIFWSIQGESERAGLPTAFIRLTGCPLRCRYCDTSYAFSGGALLTLDAIVAKVRAFAAHYVCVTGGEPLAQPHCRELLRRLADAGLDVSLETSGALDLAGIDPRICKIVDIKTPGSGEVERNRGDLLPHLRGTDQIKFVLCDRADYDWAVARLREFDLARRCGVLFSPCHGWLPAPDLAAWILADRLPVRLQLQLHKILWGEARGR